MALTRKANILKHVARAFIDRKLYPRKYIYVYIYLSSCGSRKANQKREHITVYGVQSVPLVYDEITRR